MAVAAEYAWVGLGGCLGAIARHAVGVWLVGRLGTAFPVHTLAINVTGSLAIGVLLVLLTARPAPDPMWRLFLVVGFLGGYTTFSSYTAEAIALLQAGDWWRGAWYVLGSNGLGLAACVAGIVLGQRLFGER